MNEALARVVAPGGAATAAETWAGNSPRWQLVNTPRTVAAGLALLLSGAAPWKLPG